MQVLHIFDKSLITTMYCHISIFASPFHGEMGIKIPRTFPNKNGENKYKQQNKGKP